MAEKPFKADPAYLVPIVASLAVGILCSFLFYYTEVKLEPITPAPEEGLGPMSNALFFVLMMAAGATIMYFLLKRKGVFSLKLIIGTALILISFFLSLIYFDLLFYTLRLVVDLRILFLIAFVTAFLAVISVFKFGKFQRGIVVLLVGGGLGAFLGVTIPTLSAILILAALAIYDILAVYRGPVGKLAQEGLENLPGVSLEFKDVHIGLGDLTFYSMLVGHALTNFGWNACILSSVGVLVGSYLSFKFLEKKGMFPGLPIPLSLGLTLMFISSFFGV